MVPPAALPEVERAFFRCSTTLGLRRFAVDRTVLARSLVDVDTAYGTVRVKVGAVGGEVIGAQPEFEDCRRRATAAGVPVREVMSAAVRRRPRPAGPQEPPQKAPVQATRGRRRASPAEVRRQEGPGTRPRVPGDSESR